MRRHTTVGAELLSGSSSDVMRMAEEIARTHHERWDGQGYPAGLAGEAIPLAGADLRGVRRLRRAALRPARTRSRGRVPEALEQLRRERGAALRSRGGRRLPADRRRRSIPSCWRAGPSAQLPRQPIRQRLQQQLLARVEDQQRARVVDVLDGARAARCGPRPSASARSASRRSTAWTTSGAPSATRPRRGTTARRAAAPGPARRCARGGRRAWPPRRPRARRACARAWGR